MTEDWVRIFGCEFFLLNGRSFKFLCQQIFQMGFKTELVFKRPELDRWLVVAP